MKDTRAPRGAHRVPSARKGQTNDGGTCRPEGGEQTMTEVKKSNAMPAMTEARRVSARVHICKTISKRMHTQVCILPCTFFCCQASTTMKQLHANSVAKCSYLH